MDVHRKTPLHLAAEHDHAEVLELLLGAGAELEAWTSWGATPLEWAGVLGSRRAGDVLLAHGARLTLATAAGLGMMDELRRLYREDGAVSAAFVLACRNGHTEAARFLLDRGADVDARGFFGATGLHWAAHNGHADTVRFLLETGADATLHDAQFDSDALGWAREGGHEPVVAKGAWPPYVIWLAAWRARWRYEEAPHPAQSLILVAASVNRLRDGTGAEVLPHGALRLVDV